MLSIVYVTCVLNCPLILSHKKVEHAWLAQLSRGARLKQGGTNAPPPPNETLNSHLLCINFVSVDSY